MTGGGTAGHVIPNIALMPELIKLGYEIHYIGTRNGIEKSLIEEQNAKGTKIIYHIINSGKLRRYFDVQNFTDPFKVVKGLFEAFLIIKKEKPDIVFSKGGFVSVPVVIAAHLNKIPVVAHESDITPGLANKIALPYCSKICVTFPESLKYIKGNKGVLTGTPIRKELYNGSSIRGKEICNFQNSKMIILVIGGSLGSKAVNEAVRGTLKEIIVKYNVIHICGKGNLDKTLNKTKGYIQLEYAKKELADLLALSDIVISRAGANAIFELLALKKPNILIPLSAKSSRGDQILNAMSFKKRGYSMVIKEEEINSNRILEAIENLNSNKQKYIKAMEESVQQNSIGLIIEEIKKNTKVDKK